MIYHRSKRTIRLLLLLLLLGFIGIICVPSVTMAGEIKVVDALGLTRLRKKVHASATVVVTLKEEKVVDPGKLLLQNIDGLASNIKAAQTGRNKFTFANVSIGNWKITCTDGNVKVEQVRILD
ncbi:hypothetical protein OAO01_01265 [Oligoflexia bacterium]|nr:hypothetical protein [Oligoflexia bacterium]